MGFKKIQGPLKLADALAMSGTATIHSDIQNIQNVDNLALQISWTGTPTGTLTIECSIDNVNFDALTFQPSITQPAGSTGQYLVNLEGVPYPYMRVSYTNVSGSGLLTVWYFGKDLN